MLLTACHVHTRIHARLTAFSPPPPCSFFPIILCACVLCCEGMCLTWSNILVYLGSCMISYKVKSQLNIELRQNWHKRNMLKSGWSVFSRNTGVKAGIPIKTVCGGTTPCSVPSESSLHNTWMVVQNLPIYEQAAKGACLPWLVECL